MDATGFNDSRSATSTFATASSADYCAAVDAAFMVATCLSRTTSSGRGTQPSGGISSSGRMMPLSTTPTPVQPTQPVPLEPSPASPLVQTLDKDDDEDIAEDQPMPAQPLLPARRPRAPSIADPGDAVEARAEVVPVATPAEARVQVVPVAPAIDASSEDAVTPASKMAGQYNLEPQQPWQPLPHLQPPSHPSSSSPAALPEPTTTSSLTEPEAKKQKQQQEEDDEDLAMELFHPLQPTDPPLLPIVEHQPAAAPDLEASRSRSRTHSEVSEAPTITFPDPAPDPPCDSGEEEPAVPEPSPHPPDPPSRSSSVAPTKFYSDIAKAYGRVFSAWRRSGLHVLEQHGQAQSCALAGLHRRSDLLPHA